VAIPFMAMAGASLLGSGISAFGAARVNKQNLQAQQQRQRQIDQQAAQNSGLIGNLFNGLQGQLGNLAPVQGQQATANAFSFDPLQASQVDLGSVTGGAGGQTFNAGQDGLMQFLRADPMGKMQGTNGILQEIAATGLPSDLSSIFTQASQVNQDNNADLLARVTGTGGGLGQRFGSATQRIAGDTARRLANEQSLQNSQLALQTAEAASGRRLNAASQLGQFQLQGNAQLMGAGQQQQAMILQAALANQQAQNQMGQFNVNAGMQANQQNNAQAMQAIFGNNAQMLNERQAQLQQLGIGGQLAGQQSQAMNQILGVRAGVQAPQAGPVNGATAFGGGLQDLATIMQLYNRYGQSQSQIPFVPTMPIAPIDIGPIPYNLNQTR